MDKHIEPPRFDKSLTAEELEHLSSCRFCRENLADYIEQHELLPAPSSLKASVLEQSKRLDVQFIAGTNLLSRRLQLFYFSLKVGAAILCALTILVFAPGVAAQAEKRTAQSVYQAQSAGEHWNYYEKVSQLTDQLYKLSFKNMEVLNHDKKER